MGWTTIERTGARAAPDRRPAHRHVREPGARLRTVAVAGFVCALSFVVGGVTSPLVHAAIDATTGIASAATEANTPAAPAKPPTQEILDLLDDEYYRDVDRTRLGAAPLDQLPTLLDDPYTHYLNPASMAATDDADDGVYSGVGLVLRATAAGIVVDSLVPGSPAERAAVQPGDALSAVDALSVKGLSVAGVSKRLSGDVGTPVALTVLHAGRPRTVHLTRSRMKAVLVSSSLLVSGAHRTAVVHVVEFDTGVGASVRAALDTAHRQKADRLVLDLRGNPGGLVTEAVAVASALLRAGSVVYSTTAVHRPAKTVWTADAPSDALTPLVVLVDGETASAAEIVAAALRDNRRGTVVGAKTFGKGVIQEIWPLDGGAGLKLTVAEYLTPSGEHLNRRGLTPQRTAAPQILQASTVGRLFTP